jgi:transposase InsO family protein
VNDPQESDGGFVDLPISPNLNREFIVTQPDKVWASDITYIATDEGRLFLAVVIDLTWR